jgi:hypothetical protein
MVTFVLIQLVGLQICIVENLRQYWSDLIGPLIWRMYIKTVEEINILLTHIVSIIFISHMKST